MRWLKKDIWKAGIALASTLLFLGLMVWVPVSAAGTYERAPGLTTLVTGMVQATPTIDATVTELNKEKLAQEVQQLKNQNAPDLFGWLRTNAAVLLSTLVIVIGGLVGFFRWLGDRRDEQEKRREDQRGEQEKRAEEQKRWLEDRQAEREKRDVEQQRWLKDQEAEREKRAEERFQAAVEGLSSEREEAKIGAAILLRTFLRPGYKQFYAQTFDLAVAHLRLPRIPHSAKDANTPLPHQLEESYPTTLRQALITVFKESFPLARDEWMESTEDKSFESQALDATGIQLENAYLVEADLKQVWLRQASLRNVDLRWAELDYAYLRGAYLRDAHLRGAHLYKADLRETNLCEALMREADLREVRLWGADLSNADLSHDIDLIANLSGVDLSNANLSNAYLSKTNIEAARSLKDTDLRGVKGLTKKQLKLCKAKGAIIGKAPTSSPSRSPISPSPPWQSNDLQAPSTPSAQGSTPTPSTDGSNAVSSQQDPES